MRPASAGPASLDAPLLAPLEEPLEEPLDEPLVVPLEEPLELPLESPLEEPLEVMLDPLFDAPLEVPLWLLPLEGELALLSPGVTVPPELLLQRVAPATTKESANPCNTRLRHPNTRFMMTILLRLSRQMPRTSGHPRESYRSCPTII
jgi:hypothetical protein